MKKYSILILVLIFTVIGIAATSYNSRWRTYRGAEVDGASNSYWYYSGVDTICSNDSTGFASSISQAIQLNWFGTNSGDNNNPSTSDTLVIHGASMFWLWVYMDTTKACYYTPNTLLDRYGGWLEPGTEPDSIGFGAISVTYDLETGDNAQFADSLNLVAGDGYYTHDQYGYWKYEDIIAPLAGYINQWRIYNIAVPVCGKITINITARDDLREITIIKYRFGAIK